MNPIVVEAEIKELVEREKTAWDEGDADTDKTLLSFVCVPFCP